MTSPQLPANLALAQTNPLTLNELFNSDPLSLGDPDIDRIAEYYRQRRTDFLAKQAEPKPARASGPKAVGGPKPSKPKLSADMLRSLLGPPEATPLDGGEASE